MTLSVNESDQSKVELPIKHSSKLFKEAEKQAKKRMVEDMLFIIDNVGVEFLGKAAQ